MYDDEVQRLHDLIDQTLDPTPVDYLDSTFETVTDTRLLFDDRAASLRKEQSRIQNLWTRCCDLTHKRWKVACYNLAHAEALKEYIDRVRKGLDDFELGLMSDDGLTALVEMQESGELSYQTPQRFDIEY